MAKIQRNFIAGRMNKSLDERLVPNGQYIDALNVRAGTTEETEVGSVENTKGNIPLTTLQYIDGTSLSSNAVCIGAFEDGANETIYWFVHDPSFTVGATGILDLIVSYNIATGAIIYHVVSINNSTGNITTLNFSENNLINSINKVDDLLFFTDNINPPRVININKSYAVPLNNVDRFLANDLLVIKKPPTTAPTINLFETTQTDSYLEDRIISFAYRYEYENGEYSATSQFSAPAFDPGVFQFSVNSYLNEGMLNSKNAVNITFNTGSELVKSIDLLFKEVDDSTIKIVESYNKQELGWADNDSRTVQFTNQKIFTILPSSEILRLYDNVPKLAKAQTIMSNRLIYGNYTEGYNLTDINSNPVNLEYTVSHVFDEIESATIPSNLSQGNYTISSPTIVPSINIDDSKFTINLSGQVSQLKAGTTLIFEIGFVHSAFQVPATQPTPTAPGSSFFVTWSYTLIRDYTSVYDLATDTDFVEKIGTSTSAGTQGTIQTVSYQQPNSSEGFTFTDAINAAIPQSLDSTYSLDQTGITSNTVGIPNIASPNTLRGEPVSITAPVTTGTTITFQIPAAFYIQTASPNNSAYEYFRLIQSNITFQSSVSNASLHSNRGYELGIVYMDDYNRSTTALVSDNNTVNITCQYSDFQNKIQATIPYTMLAPRWATRYKFVLKPTATTYETIYSNITFTDSDTGEAYYLLEGENANKVEAGDRLIVKRDNAGIVNRCANATVLEKETKAANFITVQVGGVTVEVPGGVYMKINPSNFSATNSYLSNINVNIDPVTSKTDNRFPVIVYPFFIAGSPNTQYDVPIGTEITFTIEMTRNGGSATFGPGCSRRNYTYDKTFTASRDFTDMKAWFEGDNIGLTLDDGIKELSPDSQTMNNTFIAPYSGSITGEPNTYINTLSPGGSELTEAQIQNVFGSSANDPFNTNYYTLYTNGSDNYLIVNGTAACSDTPNRQSTIDVNFQVIRANSTTVFETEPTEALPDVWFENNESFVVNADGTHNGNVTNQNTSTQTNAVINTNFFNCFAFGNGVESYKVRDSITGKSFSLGNRVYSTSNVDYKEAHRFADLTYSGVYNDETNVNKLNEFNLGLVNFKPLEDSFGDIEVLYARETDILTLQEDKISYVLAGKNILTDAVGGGSVTSVPEVLGTQIARIEDYGISNNPESFTAWGADKFFTDIKRGVVLRLTGSSAQNEQLSIISEEGMRSWFRDLFTTAMMTQKLGAYDPYMNEYVFSSNTKLLPQASLCLACNVAKNITIPANDAFIYCVDVTTKTGTITVDYIIPTEQVQDIITESTQENIVTEGGVEIETESSQSFTFYTVNVIYNGVTYSSGPVNVSGSFTFNKNASDVTQAVVSVTSDASFDDTIQITVGCPSSPVLNVYSVCVTSSEDAGKFIHNEFLWTNGATTSPLESDSVTFSTNTTEPIVSQYQFLSGEQGSGVIPPENSTITIRSNKINFDNFVFNTTSNKFRYLRTDTVYQNTPSNITSLLSASIEATPLNTAGAPTLYSANFGLPVGGNNLYIIYDYRESTSQSLCYSSTTLDDACCNCTPIPAPTPSPTPTPSPVAPAPQYNYYRAFECFGGTVFIKALTSFNISPGDVVLYEFQGFDSICATIEAVAGTGLDGEVTAIVNGCSDSRCGIDDRDII